MTILFSCILMPKNSIHGNLPNPSSCLVFELLSNFVHVDVFLIDVGHESVCRYGCRHKAGS